jgi:hypothetical protein
MTRDEAIDAACYEVRKELEKNNCLSFRVHMNEYGITVAGNNFPFEPRRRIPRLGTPVKDLDSGRLGFVSWLRVNHIRELWVEMTDTQGNIQTVWSTMNWVELQEVKP